MDQWGRTARFGRFVVACARNGKVLAAAALLLGLVIAALVVPGYREGNAGRDGHREGGVVTTEQGTNSTSPTPVPAAPHRADRVAGKAPSSRWLDDASDEPMSAAQLAPYFDDLVERARSGDLRAAQVLHQSLGNCHGRLADISADTETTQDPVQRTRRHRAESCRGFTRAQLRLDEEIVRGAADRGDDAMRIAYYSLDPTLDGDDSAESLQRYRATALIYLSEAASHQNPAAYWALSDAYAVGRIVERDPVLARAYALALNGDATAGDDSPQARLIAAQILAGHWP